MVLDLARSEMLATDLTELVDREPRRRHVLPGIREDMRQEILLWFLAARHKFAEVSPALVGCVVRRFLRPKNRRRYREPVPVQGLSGGESSFRGLPTALYLYHLDGIERRLVELLLAGMKWSGACAEAGIHSGSRAYWRRRLRRRFESTSP